MTSLAFSSWFHGLAPKAADAILSRQRSDRSRIRRSPRNRCHSQLHLEPLETRILMTAGFLDSAFDSDGIAAGTFNVGLAAVEVQADGKILVAGQQSLTSGRNSQSATALARYNADGTLDTSFGVGGKRITDLNTKKNDWANDIALQSDGKIVVTSGYDTGGNGGMSFSVQRYLANGTLDSSFGGGGKVSTDLGSTSDQSTELVIQPDGKILVGGRTGTANGLDFALVRYLANGVIDTSFGSGGKVITSLSADNDFLHALSIQLVDVAGTPTPRILAAGNHVANGQADFALARYDLAGNLDASFGVAGMVRLPQNLGTGYVYTLAIQPDGKILAGGGGPNPVSASSDMCVARFLTDGMLDATFGQGGIAFVNGGLIEQAKSLQLQADGKIVLGGYRSAGSSAIDPSQDLFFARLDLNGGLDGSFGTGGIATFDSSGAGDSIEAISIQSDGRIVGVGVTGGTSLVVRLTSDDLPSAFLAASVPVKSVEQSLRVSEYQPLVVEALSRWEAADVDTSSLSGMTVQVRNLGGTTLGLASGTTIWLDDNAAGWGWFVDSTPGSSSEFVRPGNQGERNRMDLLTVVMHEIGHLLGQEHNIDGVMAETLATGVRRTEIPSAHTALVDLVFGQLEAQQTGSLLDGLLDEQRNSRRPWFKRRR